MSSSSVVSLPQAADLLTMNYFFEDALRTKYLGNYQRALIMYKSGDWWGAARQLDGVKGRLEEVSVSESQGDELRKRVLFLTPSTYITTRPAP